LKKKKKKYQTEFEKLENERKAFEKNNYNNVELKNTIIKLNKKTSEMNTKNEDACRQLNQLLSTNTEYNNQIQQEITRLRQLRQQQEELFNNQKKIKIINH